MEEEEQKRKMFSDSFSLQKNEHWLLVFSTSRWRGNKFDLVGGPDTCATDFFYSEFWIMAFFAESEASESEFKQCQQKKWREGLRNSEE